MSAARTLQAAEPSVIAMLLQMVLEKLGKAALLRSGQITIQDARSTHKAANAMMMQLARNTRACRRLGYQPGTIRHYFTPLVDQLERSQPTVTPHGPHLEYPWETLSGEIQWPAKHLAAARVFRAKNPYGLRLYLFIGRLCDRFDQVFP